MMIEIQNPRSETDVADWIELTISLTEKPLSKTYIAKALEQVGAEEVQEAFIAGVWRELSYRQKLYSPALFSVEARTIEPSPEVRARIEYRACLLLSLFGLPENAQLPSKLFERLTSKAMECYLSGSTAVFGWPFDLTDTPDDKESQIKRKIKSLSSAMCEKFCEAPPPSFKDRGLDVAGWIPFGESRSGQVVILLQCAAGHNWRDKRAVPIHNWNQYITWACDPVRAYAVPCVVTERDWHEQSREKGILFDRIRILNLLSDGLTDETLLGELDTWVQDQLADQD